MSISQLRIGLEGFQIEGVALPDLGPAGREHLAVDQGMVRHADLLLLALS